MYRHKEPLDFVESPYEGSKRYNTPVLGARRPYLAPSVVVDKVEAKWVSPQFKPDDPSMVKKAKRKKRERKEKKNNSDSVLNHKTDEENPNLFPKLKFTSGAQRKTKDKIGIDIHKDRHFLFDLGSPKTPTMQGSILVKATPDEQIDRDKWTKRLRPRKI